MSRSARSTCNLTVEQLTAERPKRANVGGAIQYLAHCSPDERAEALARADAGFAELLSQRKVVAAPATLSVPAGRSEHYMKKKLVAVVFVLLEDHRDTRGTMRASSDGTIRRAFSFKAKGLLIEPESCSPLILAGIPRNTLSWITAKQPQARFAWQGGHALDGEWTDEQQAHWAHLNGIASRTKGAIERACKPPPRKEYGNGRIYNPW